MPRGKGSTNPQEELERCIERRENGCWIWTGPVSTKGWPAIYSGRKTIDVRRWLYRLQFLALSEKETLRPACYNELCVSPFHQVQVKRGRRADEETPRVGGRPNYLGQTTKCPRCGSPLIDRDEDGDRKCPICAFVLVEFSQDVLDEVEGRLLDSLREQGVT